MASSFPAHGATPLLSFFSISPCSLGRQQPWRGLLFFSWRSSKLPHGRRPGKLPQWRQQQGSLPPPHGAQKIAARLLCSSSLWSRFCAELRAGARHGQICPLHGRPLLFPAPSSLYPARPIFFHGKPTVSPLPRCSSWCPPAVRQNAQQAARCSSPPVRSPSPRRVLSLSCSLRSPIRDAVSPR